MNYEPLGNAAALGIFKKGAELILKIPSAIHEGQTVQQAKLEDYIARQSIESSLPDIVKKESDIILTEKEISLQKQKQLFQTIGIGAAILTVGIVAYMTISK